MFRNVLRFSSKALNRARQAGRRTAGGFGAEARASYVCAAKLAQNTGSASTACAIALSVAVSVAVTPAAFASSLEKTYIMIKPDGVNRGLISEIVKRFESKGYKLVGIKVVVPSRALAEQHYAEHDGKPFFPKLVDFLSSGAVVAMVWEGKDVVRYGRTMIGATNPLASPPGTIRGDYGIDMGRNIIHGSDSVESAQREIALWFDSDELADYELVTQKWVYE